MSDRAELAAVCDSRKEEGLRVAERYGARFYADYEEMLDRERCDIVDICTPDYLHCRQIEMAARKGCHVLCEKPLATTYAEVTRIREAVREHGVFVMPAMNQRWFHAYAQARLLIDGGKIGRPVFGRYVWKGTFYPYPPGSYHRKKESRGQFLHNGIHYLDVMCFLMNTLPVAAFAQTARHYEEDPLETPN